MSISISRRPSRRKRRKSALAATILTLLILITFYHKHAWSIEPTPTPEEVPQPVQSNPLLNRQAQFWRSLFHIILNNDPQCSRKPDIVIPEKLDIGFEDTHFHNRPDILWIDDADLQRLKLTHQNFLNDIHASKIRLVYQKGTRGVITTVSDTQIPVLLIQLRMLRATGSSLPVEVFLSQPTLYNEHVCKNIISTFAASCIYFSSIFNAAETGVTVASYQYKVLAILFSSFDEILLLDSDAWPISNPDHLFTYPPFTDTGLVLWPDFWYASESPYYFKIAKIEKPLPLHVKPSVESGELLYSKSKHDTSILLAAYYNYYGPDYYYPLLSQGAPGQGDKETFGSAALALDEDFSWVKTEVTAMGRMDSSGHFLGSAMIQYDPIVDFQHREASPEIVPVSTEDTSDAKREEKGVPPKKAKPPKRVNKPMFMHANFPKFDPRTIFVNHAIGDGVNASPARDSNGTYVRCWEMSPESAIARFGYDVERRFWQVIKQVACEDLVGEGDMSRKVNEIRTCTDVKKYIQTVFDGYGETDGRSQDE